jgi:hypothetical protein
VLGPSLGHLDVAESCLGLDGQEEVRGAVALLLVVDTQRLARLGGQGRSNLLDELDRHLVEADNSRSLTVTAGRNENGG